MSPLRYRSRSVPRRRTASVELVAEVDQPAVRLPSGVRDYLPAATRRRRGLAEALVDAFERWGYQRIVTPAFEYEEVLARGLGPAARAGAIRFVEPLSGEVAILRPDLTPQVARIVATRLADAPGPLRLCYEGSVLRFSPGLHGQREIIQAGVELYGLAAPAGDLEVIALAAASLVAIGLGDFTLDLGHPAFARGVLMGLGLTGARHEALLTAVARKDQAAVRALVRRSSASAGVRRLGAALPGLYGDGEVLRRARGLCQTAAQRAALTQMHVVVEGLRRLGLAERVSIDLGELRGFDYYTGLRFAAYVDGLGEAILAGGRYDDLCVRYGRSRPATGFAIDVEAAAAVHKARHVASPAAEPMILIAGALGPAARAAAALRQNGRRAATHPAASSAALQAYAAQWEHATIIKLSRLSDSQRAALMRGLVPEASLG
jgi:ATP phosphoribosyltransferase regulatory subunit